MWVKDNINCRATEDREADVVLTARLALRATRASQARLVPPASVARKDWKASADSQGHSGPRALTASPAPRGCLASEDLRY